MLDAGTDLCLVSSDPPQLPLASLPIIGYLIEQYMDSKRLFVLTQGEIDRETC